MTHHRIRFAEQLEMFMKGQEPIMDDDEMNCEEEDPSITLDGEDGPINGQTYSKIAKNCFQ